MKKEEFELKYGGHTGVVPPVPIPNTVVKYPRVDDSGYFPAKVDRPRILTQTLFLF